MTMIKFGELDANIAGDHRYTDVLTVSYDSENKNVHIQVRSSSPNGGMDTLGSGIHWRSMHDEIVAAEPKVILKSVKRVISNSSYNFKTYGKPTKRFEWMTSHREYSQGLNVVLVTKAIEYVV